MRKINILIQFSLFTCLNLYAQQVLTEAEQLISEGQYLEAVDTLRQYILENPSNQEAHYFLGEAYNRLSCPDGSNLNNANLYYAFKATEEFVKVIKISPYYGGRIFSQGPHSKLTSVWGTMATTYAFRGDLDSAKWAFEYGREQGGFDPSIVEYNKNVLITCAPNAILFTNGDNDTFPALYLQLIENYRRDITVINCSLLNVIWYIKQQRKNIFSDTSIIINLDDEEIDKLRPIKWKPKEVIISVPSMDLNTEDQMKYYDITDSEIIEEGHLKFIMPNTLTFEDITAIRVQDIMIKEIIESNSWERPIFFANTCLDDNKIGLQDFLRSDGLALRLVPQKRKDDMEFINETTLTRNLNNYTYQFVGNEKIKYYDFSRIFKNYLNPYLRLAVYYSEIGDDNNTLETLYEMNEKLPCEELETGYGWLFEIAILYFQAGNTEKFQEFSALVEERASQELISNPDDVSSYYNPYRILIEIYEKNKDYEKVISIWEKIEIMYPDDPAVKFNIEKYRELLSK